MSTQKRLNGSYPQIPRQKLSIKAKTDKWREACVDAIDGLSSSIAWDGRSSKAKKAANYDLMNSKIDPADYNYVMDAYGYGEKYGKTPGRLRCMNIVRQKIEKLVGDEIQRPFDFGVMAVGGEGVSAKAAHKKKVLLDTAKYLIRKDLGMTNEEEEAENFQSLKEAESSFTSYADIRERYASAIIKNGLEDERLEFTFQEGFQHGLVVGEEIYYVGIVANKPVVRTVNPLYFEWEKGPENKKVQDAGWTREERFMSTSEIIDEFTEYLTEKQIEDLDNGSVTMGMNTMLPKFAYTMDTMQSLEYQSSYDARSRTSYLRVVTVCWKSMKKIGFMSWTDENGDEQQTMVDETKKLTEEEKEAGYTIEWEWISEVWKGTKIGDDIYVDINPTDNQMRTMDNPSECKMPYVGATYNNMNSETTALLDLMKPHQFLFNVLWYKLETEIAKSDGKKISMDLANMPTSHGMTMEKWMYYFKEMGIMYTNSAEEGKAGTRLMGPQGAPSPIQDFDLTMSQTVQQYMMVMAKLEQLIDTISGTPKQAEGQIAQYETATGIQASMTNASTMTASYFYTHDEIKREVLRQYVEASKYAYAEGKKINYITNDLERITVEIDSEIFVDSDYNVFPTNSNRDKLIKQKIEQLAPIAMQQDKANFSDMVRLIKTNSMSEFEQILIQGEQEKIARDQEMQQMQERINEQNIQAAEAKDIREHQQELETIDRKGEWDMRKAVVQAQGFDTDKDRNNNGVPDVVEVGSDQIETMKLSNDAMKAKDTRAFEAQQKGLDRELEREKIAAQERMNKDNNKTALKNKVVGESKSSK